MKNKALEKWERMRDDRVTCTGMKGFQHSGSHVMLKHDSYNWEEIWVLPQYFHVSDQIFHLFFRIQKNLASICKNTLNAYDTDLV